MARWIVIPAKAPAACKQRLRGVLADAAHEGLVAQMLAHVVATAGAAAGPDDRVMILGPERHGLPAATALLPDEGNTLNTALAAAARRAMEAGAERLVSISADLPFVSVADIAALLAIGEEMIGLAPDHHGRGTNAVSLPLPVGHDFGFAFGSDSLARHSAEALRIGVPLRLIERPGLASDVDVPDDLTKLPG